MPKQIIIIRQSSARRQISADEALAALTEEEKKLDREQFEVSTAEFAEAVEQGDWDGHDHYLREEAAKIRARADAIGDAHLHYFGLAEVPHIIALGAHIGAERAVTYHDHNRDTGCWSWSTDTQTVRIQASGLEPLQTTVNARGAAVVRVAISEAIPDADIRAIVGEETLAEISITHAGGVAPTYGIIKSDADVAAVRRAFRDAYALLRKARPNIDVVHLFVAGPPSVCFAVGQELSLLNAPPVQTYRHRKVEEQSSQQPAMRLSASSRGPVLAPLTDNEIKAAARIRNELWLRALKEVEEYAARKRDEGHVAGAWYEGLEPNTALKKASPFPGLPALPSFIPLGVAVDSEPVVTRDYAFEENTKRWRLNDRLLLALHRAVGGDEDRLLQLIRLFLFHEYVHLEHSIGKHTADEVGKFSNCLEHIDYTADTYALFHQLDFVRYRDPGVLASFESIRAFLARQLQLAIDSFWAFDESTGNEWQIRRIRRYLNWYWRLVQIENAENLDSLFLLFTRQPRIEIGGLFQVARGRRVLALLDRRDRTTHLELAVVLENEVLFRQSDSPNTNLPALLESFRNAVQPKIQEFFRALYSIAKARGAVQPRPRE